MAHEAAPRASVAPTRRALLRATAWSLPVVAVATAAPAYASSQGGGEIIVMAATLSATNGSASSTSNGTNYIFTGRVTITNPATAPTQGLQVVLTLNGYPLHGNESVSGSGGSGLGAWTSSVNTSQGIVITLTAPTQLAGNTSTTVTFKIAGSIRPGSTGSISTMPHASNLPSLSTSFTVARA
ncbi:hypothetical protein IEQ44_09225 [Nocardioides sp. Y6]|uniref:DUF11 domain-containing protein n=1 Tax=Nocardioides malaquae TaxID=2773426 RepID=A0ABR9RTB9_9ACTN|nr:hypothetical protein [Nocardioides malaquae]MBE7324835.1 hypothetical protein [Nocardioides malaquae]